ncbi:MAG: ATP-binding protein [Candidatus Limnocylindrales bacterium]
MGSRDDVREDPRYAAVRDDVRSELCVPLIADGQPIGVINVESVTADRYTEIDERVLSIVAAQVAVAIHNARLDARMQTDQARVRHAERVEAAARLAAGAAHDVRGVITAIRGYTELAGATIPSGHRAHDDLQAIRATCDRGTALTDQLMDIGRSSSLRPVALDLRETVDATRPTVGVAAGAAHRIEWALAPGPIPAMVDPRAIERILVNLVTNARDASAAGSTIGVRLDGDASQAWLEVIDHGAGMDADTLEHAFEAFFSTKGSARGTGLGLAVVEGLVAASGGEVSVDSAPGRGTTVRITLPAAAA